MVGGQQKENPVENGKHESYPNIDDLRDEAQASWSVGVANLTSAHGVIINAGGSDSCHMHVEEAQCLLKMLQMAIDEAIRMNSKMKSGELLKQKLDAVTSMEVLQKP